MQKKKKTMSDHMHVKKMVYRPGPTGQKWSKLEALSGQAWSKVIGRSNFQAYDSWINQEKQQIFSGGNQIEDKRVGLGDKQEFWLWFQGEEFTILPLMKYTLLS